MMIGKDMERSRVLVSATEVPKTRYLMVINELSALCLMFQFRQSAKLALEVPLADNAGPTFLLR